MFDAQAIHLYFWCSILHVGRCGLSELHIQLEICGAFYLSDISPTDIVWFAAFMVAVRESAKWNRDIQDCAFGEAVSTASGGV